MTSKHVGGLSTLEYHVLVAIAKQPMHGYAIRDAVEAESEHTLSPRAGTLYRVIARLMSSGLVEEAEGYDEDGRYPGRARRYYELSPEGRVALVDEARRLEGAAALALDRLRART